MKWDVNSYQQQHNFVFQYGEAVSSMLQPRAGERILDLGCGSGELTAHIASSGAEVVGLDSSPEMIQAARAAYPEIEWVQASGTDFAFDQPFDAIFSNAALHWMHPPEDVVRCMAKSLKEGGRLIIEMGGQGNIRHLQTAMRNALLTVAGRVVDFERYYPTIGAYSTLLEAHNLSVRSAGLIPRPTVLQNGEHGLADWYRQFDAVALEGLSLELRNGVIEEAENSLRDRLFNEKQWTADYVRLRIAAIKDSSLSLI
jgi:trans-aconitate methyltransferase